LDGEALDAGRERDGAGHARAGALDGVGDFAGRLVYDPEVISLEADSDALCCHTKNNCLLMVVKSPLPILAKRGRIIATGRQVATFFFGNFASSWGYKKPDLAWN
jgi:hypothetical protein